MKIKHILLFLLLFLGINFTVYILTKINTDSKIAIVLDENENTLSTHYHILLESQKHISYAIYKSILKNTDAIELLETSYSASKAVQARNRDKLYKELVDQYETAKKQGILQLQFVFPNNVSFLRVHKPSKFGDDLTIIREDFKYVNKTQKPIRGFTHGKTSHGFRNTFPIFNKENKHIGAIEISFTSESFQWYLNSISHIHSHFLVKKEIFDSKSWNRDDMVLKYVKSSENPDYMLSLGDMHTKEQCVVENGIKLHSVMRTIDKKMKEGNAFALYVEWKKNIEVVSFLPIKNLKKKSVAWIVAYKESPIIESSFYVMQFIQMFSFLVSVVIIYILILQVKNREILEEKNRIIEKEQELVNDILNSTDNIMVVTDFVDIKYSNNRFKNLLNIDRTKQLNTMTKHNILDIFVKSDGYLHAGLLQENETFPSLIARTRPEDRVVSILDKNYILKVFNISISKSKNNGDYLVTLTDITKMREHYNKAEEKAYIDTLTSVNNRNKFDEIFQKELQSAAKGEQKLCLAIIDIDKFKDFNDSYGHLIGDEVLVQMATSIKNNTRVTDTFARWGGEEFVILFRGIIIDEAIIVANKLRVLISSDKHPVAGYITASFGLTEYREGDNMESMFKRCDDALYIAKANGRNRVEVK